MNRPVMNKIVSVSAAMPPSPKVRLNLVARESILYGWRCSMNFFSGVEVLLGLMVTGARFFFDGGKLLLFDWAASTISCFLFNANESLTDSSFARFCCSGRIVFDWLIG